MATSRNYTSPEGERKNETTWFDVVTWNKLAETCNQFLVKGKKVYVEGRLRTSNWEGQDGQKHYRTEIIANRVLFLDRQATASISQENHQDVEPEEIPF